MKNNVAILSVLGIVIVLAGRFTSSNISSGTSSI